MAKADHKMTRFGAVLSTLESGYHTGQFEGRSYGVTIERPVNARITKLFAQELGGSDYVSFNLFNVGKERAVLKPCEMSSGKVIEFVLNFRPTDKAAIGTQGLVLAAD